MAARALPIEILRGVNLEADELIAGLALAQPKTAKRIVSSDRDFLQLISPTTSVYAPVSKVIIDHANFDEMAPPKTPSGARIVFPRDRYVDYRALSGDPSDTLTGVPGVGALSAAKLVAAAPVDSYFGDAASVRAALGRKSAAVEQAFADGTAREIVERNRVLMDLRQPAECWSRLDELTTRGPWDRSAFESWLDEQKLTTVDRGMFVGAMEGLSKVKRSANG
jgi:5'-3' exonuclease